MRNRYRNNKSHVTYNCVLHVLRGYRSAIDYVNPVKCGITAMGTALFVL